MFHHWWKSGGEAHFFSKWKSYLGHSDGHSSSRLWPPALCHKRPGRWTSHEQPEAVFQSSKLNCLRWLLVARVSQPASGSLFLAPHYKPQPLWLRYHVWWSSICICQVWRYHIPGLRVCPPHHTQRCPGTPPRLYDWSAQLEERKQRHARKCVFVCVCLLRNRRWWCRLPTQCSVAVLITQ